jgi:lipid II:glycine glycyltransferase (peptidoglycan interpeptide bridge formation enzyme)
MHEASHRPVAISPEELPPANTFLQSRFWAEVKRSFGWEPLAFRIGETPLLVLLRRFGRGLSLAYVPHGPAGEARSGDGENAAGFETRAADLAGIHHSVAEQLPSSAAAVRYDLPWRRPEDFDEHRFASLLREEGIPGFRRAAADIQPPSTVLVSLAGDEEELLARMKRKTRYNVRLASKRGVSTTVSAEPDLGRWYRLYRETAERDRIAIHSEAYYRRLFELAEHIDGAPRLFLVEAFHEGEYLAGNIIALYRGTATYMYGASSNRKRNLMPSYAVQWASMRLAGEEGCSVYDLFGIPPAEDPSHPMHGLYRFKTGFGGEIIHRCGGWDAPVSGLRYAGFRLAEAVRSYYHKRLKKR